MTNKVAAAEGIRGIACFMVVFSHLSLSFFPGLHAFDPPNRLEFSSWETAFHHSPLTFIFSGTAAVYIFFVLSGYVLSYAINRGNDPIYRLKSMCIKRLPRLMLPAFVSCLLLWAAFTYMHVDAPDLSLWADELGENPGSFMDAVYDGTIRTFWYGWSQLNWVLWTMKIELVGSLLVFGLLYARYKQWNLWWVTPLLMVPSYIAIRMTPFDVQVLHKWTWLDILENNLELFSFLIGMLIYFKFRQIKTVFALLLLCLGLYFAGVHDNSHAYAWINPYLAGRSYNILNFLSGPLIVAPILMNSTLSNFFSTKIPVYLGKISFAAYLTHLLIIYIVGIPLFNAINANPWEITYTQTALLACLGVLIGTILFSELYYRIVDKKAMQFSGWLSDLFLKRRTTTLNRETAS